MPIASESADNRACRPADFFAGATPGPRPIRAAIGHVQRDFRRTGGNGPGIPFSDILCPGYNHAGDNRTRDACRTASDIASGTGRAFRITCQSVRRPTRRRARAGACAASDAAANFARNRTLPCKRTRAYNRGQPGAAA